MAFDFSKLGLKPQSQIDAEKNSGGAPTPNAAPAAETASTDGASVAQPQPTPVTVPTKGFDFKLAAPKALIPPATGTELVAVVQGESAEVIDGPAGFQAKLDKLDSLVSKETGISQLSIDTARAYVRDIMLELRVYPEYDGILIDRDTHNIMAYVQASQLQVGNAFVVAKEKRVKAADKKAAAGNAAWDLTSLGDMSLSPPLRQIQNKALTQGLDALASLNVDAIEAKNQK